MLREACFYMCSQMTGKVTIVMLFVQMFTMTYILEKKIYNTYSFSLRKLHSQTFEVARNAIKDRDQSCLSYFWILVI